MDALFLFGVSVCMYAKRDEIQTADVHFLWHVNGPPTTHNTSSSSIIHIYIHNCELRIVNCLSVVAFLLKNLWFPLGACNVSIKLYAWIFILPFCTPCRAHTNAKSHTPLTWNWICFCCQAQHKNLINDFGDHYENIIIVYIFFLKKYMLHFDWMAHNLPIEYIECGWALCG